MFNYTHKNRIIHKFTKEFLRFKFLLLEKEIGYNETLT